MIVQLDIFLSTQNRDNGILRAVTHADEVDPGWQDKAYQFLISFKKDIFLVEDVRKAAEGIVPEPICLRAWGAIILKASRAGIVKRIGFSNVKNVRAHCTPVSLWQFVNRKTN